MRLSKAERWILSNQFRIMDHLDVPDGNWDMYREIVEDGYELHYDIITEHIYDPPDVMTEDDCREVLDILDMYSALGRAYEQHEEDLEDIKESSISFPGFDGNNETKQLGYVRFVVGRWNRFTWLNRGDDFNSHMPSLPIYRRMLNAWNAIEDRHQLTPDQVRAVLAERVHTDYR